MLARALGLGLGLVQGRELVQERVPGVLALVAELLQQLLKNGVQEQEQELELVLVRVPAVDPAQGQACGRGRGDEAGEARR
eukprot:m.36020 g.36020  ORF g.36020 m.36020 type:complete len:81 (-) comp10982_c0_seq1:79-321(-)